MDLKAADRVQGKQRSEIAVFFPPPLEIRRCTSAPRYTAPTCTFYSYIAPGEEFVFDKLGSGDASAGDWTSWVSTPPL